MRRKTWLFPALFTVLTTINIAAFFLRESARDILQAVLAKNREIADLRDELKRFAETIPLGLPNEVLPNEEGDIGSLYPRASEVVSVRDLPKREDDAAYYSLLIIKHKDGSEVRVIVKSAPSLVTDWLKDKMPWR